MIDYQKAYDVLNTISWFAAFGLPEEMEIERIIEENYPSLEDGIISLSIFIEKSKIKPSFGLKIREMMKRQPGGRPRAINLIWYWAITYLPVYETCVEKREELKEAIKKAYGCLFRIVVDDFRLKNISKLQVKDTWKTYHRTGEIIVGVLNLCNDYTKGYILEYISYGKKIFHKCVKDEGVCKIYLEPEDLHLIPALVIAHEYAHYIAWLKHGHRRRESGRREVHDAIFVETYEKLLHEMAQKCFPELRKYISKV